MKGCGLFKGMTELTELKHRLARACVYSGDRICLTRWIDSVQFKMTDRYDGTN